MASSTNNEKIEKERPTVMFQGKNIHSSPVDGKLLCSFSEKTCMQRRLNHYAFCIRHVLEDKNSPFKQCKFVAKYNGQRCTNAIPLKEDRIYCNSHLQVLGLVPKKSRKKKTSEQSVHTSKHVPKSSATERLLPVNRGSQHASSRRSERATGRTETLKTSPEQRASRKAKLLSSNPLLCQLVSTYSQTNSQNRNLLPFYGVCSSDDDESDDDNDSPTAKKLLKKCTTESNVERLRNVHSTDTKFNLRSAKLQRLREKLRAELLDVKKTINSHNKDVKQSDEALGFLVTAVRSNPALTTAAIHDKSFVLSSRKRSSAERQDSIVCTAETPEKLRCKRTSVPYTKYCYQHILKDSKQQLFHPCSADILPTSKCSKTSLDLLYEKPLCCEHSSGKEAVCHPMAPPVERNIPAVPLAVQKTPAKKARRKPQAKALAAPKPAKSNRKSSKKESNKTSKSDKSKKGSSAPLSTKLKQELMLNHTVNQMNFDKSIFPTEEREQHTSLYPLNGAIKLEELPSNKSDIFDNSSFKEQEMFDENEIDENDDFCEDLGDISPTGMLSVLPPESPDHTRGSHVGVKQRSPVDAFSMNEALLHNHIGSSNTAPRKDDTSSSVNHSNVISGHRPSRTSVITLPKYPSSTSSHGVPVTRLLSPGIINTEYTGFKPIGPGVIKSEGGTRKGDPRPIDVGNVIPFFPLPFEPVLNPQVAWGGGGKFVVNNRARPLVISGQMNPVTFSPPSLSPHVSPQITLGTAFNFDRPTVLQHSNSPSPTLSPFSANLPNSPHGKLAPRTLRMESRGNSTANDIHDPFFGASFDKP